MKIVWTEGNVRFTRYNGILNFRNYVDWQLHVNGGWREAVLLARSGFSFLFIYESNFNYFLAEISIGLSGRFDPHSYKSVSKKKLSAKWNLAEWFVDKNEVELGIKKGDYKFLSKVD